MEPVVHIFSFDPLHLELPQTPVLSGTVRVRLPPVRLKLFDLSLGGIIPDSPYIGTEVPIADITIGLIEPMKVGEIVDLIANTATSWQALWQAVQESVDEHGAIFR